VDKISSKPTGGSTPGRPTPLEILQERYAEGEIDTQEYEERSKLLRN
jgi:uncharacterized membrane protein